MTTTRSRRVLTLRNMPASSATPTEALQDYRKEIDELRDRLGQAKAQISALQKKMRHDGSMPVLRTKAFVEEVKTIRERSIKPPVERRKTSAGPGCLAEIRVANLTTILERLGDRASDAALAHVANMLSGNIRQTDRVGRLGTASFGVLLAFADPVGVTAKMERLCQSIEETPLLWQGEAIEVKLDMRLAALDS